jgi:hypothetical protein
MATARELDISEYSLNLWEKGISGSDEARQNRRGDQKPGRNGEDHPGAT